MQFHKFKKIQKTKKDISSVKSKVFMNLSKSTIIYEKIFHFNQADLVIIKNSNTQNCILIVIKTFKRFINIDLQYIIKSIYENIVQLLDVFDLNKSEMCMMYEQIKISLRLINEKLYTK